MKMFSKTWVLGILSVIVLTANFSSHFLSTLPLKGFLDNEYGSERFVETRIAVNNDLGLDYDGGFMFAAPFASEDLRAATDKEPYKDFRQRALSEIENREGYKSHIGFQDDLLYPIWSGLYKVRDIVLEKAKDGSRMQRRMTHFDSYYIIRGTQYFVAFLNALALSFILIWIMKEFSAPIAYISLASLLIFAPDLTFFGRSMWWMMFSWFLPIITVLLFYSKNKGQPLHYIWGVFLSVIAGGFLTLQASMGYEYTSTIMVSTMVPIIYYALSRQWTFKTWFFQSFIVGIGQILGIALTLYLHYLSLENHGIDASRFIESRFEMRAYGGDTSTKLTGLMGESIDSNLFLLYLHYLFANTDMGLPQFVLLIPLCVCLFKKRKSWKIGFTECPVEKGLLASIAVGFFGAMSMLTILKGHAYVHHFDVVVFSMPMNIFLFILYARWVMNFRDIKISS